MPGALRSALAPLRENERLLMIMVSTTLVMSGQGIITPVLPLFARSFGAGAAAIGLTLSVFALARVVLNVPLGLLADRNGRRPLLILGPLVSALGMIGSGFATGIGELLAWRALAGAGSAMYMNTAQVYLADISTSETRARILGANHAALLFGVTLGPGIGGLLGELFGYRMPFFAVGGAGVIAALYGYLRLPETRPAPLEIDATSRSQASQPSWRTLLGSRDFLAVCAVTASIFASRAGGRFTLMALLAVTKFDYTTGALGALFTVMALVNLFGVAPAAVIADRFGRKWAIVPSGAVIAFAFVLLAVSDSQALFLVAACVLAVGTSIIGPAPAAYAADIAPPALRGLTLGAFRTAGDVGFVLGPVLLGALADATSIAWGLTANAVLVLAASGYFAVAARETVHTIEASPPTALDELRRMPRNQRL